MTPEAQRIAIAEFCGLLERKDGAVVEFQRWDAPDAIWQRVKFPDGRVSPCIVPNIPDYLNDLNAIHDGELKIDREFYTAQLLAVIHEVDSDYFNKISWENGYELATATAAHRAEALLRTIGKWDDSK